MHHTDTRGVLITPDSTTLIQVVYWLHHIDAGGVLIAPDITTLIQVMYWLHLITPHWYRWWSVHYISLTQDVEHLLYVINIDGVWLHSTEIDGIPSIQVEYGLRIIDTGGVLITSHWHSCSIDRMLAIQMEYWLHHIDTGGILTDRHWHNCVVDCVSAIQIEYSLRLNETDGILIEWRLCLIDMILILIMSQSYRWSID